jgi:hypothetical protein
VFVFISPFLFLISLIWVLSLHILLRFARTLSTSFLFHWFFDLCFVDFRHYFYYFSTSAYFGLSLFLFF